MKFLCLTSVEDGRFFFRLLIPSNLIDTDLGPQMAGFELNRGSNTHKLLLMVLEALGMSRRNQKLEDVYFFTTLEKWRLLKAVVALEPSSEELERIEESLSLGKMDHLLATLLL